MRFLAPMLLGTLLCLTAACTLMGEQEPPLDDDTFVAVIADLHLLEARADLPEAEELPPEVRDSLFAYHGVTKAAYDATVGYYAERPREYHALYRRVIDRLREDEMGVLGNEQQ